MSSRARSGVVVLAAAAWTLWVVAHYYAFPVSRPEIADGILGSAFPYWREAAWRTFASLFGVILTLLAAWGFGRIVLAALNRRSRHEADAVFAHTAERLIFELACGFLALSSLCFGLAVLHAYRAPAVHALLAVGVSAALVPLLRSRPALPRLSSPSLDNLLPAAVILLALLFAFVAALAPEIEYDALWYHLWLPQRWLDAGAPVDLVNEYISLYPLQWELLYGVAMSVGGPGAAKLLHFATLPLLAVATGLLARSLVPRASSTLAACLAVASPTIMWEATTAYVDLALALFLTLSVHALTRFERTGRRVWLVLSALMMGGALATKHLALLALAAMIIVLVDRHLVARASWRAGLRNATLFLFIALALPAPWYARAWAASGNPVFPSLYGLFGAHPAERWSPATEAALRRFESRFGLERRVPTLALLPWDMSVHGARYGGTFGPLFLILVPLAFLGGPLPRPARLVAAGCGVYLVLWASPLSSFQLRFVIPLLPMLAAFAAAGFANVRDAAERMNRPAARLAFVPLAIVLFLNLPPFIRLHERDRVEWKGWLTHVLRMLPARVVLGATTEDDYLTASVPSYRAWTFINRNLPLDSRILTFSGGDQLYSARARLWSDAAAASTLTWGAPTGTESDVFRRARRLGISHVLFDKQQLDGGALAGLAIASDKMRICCLTPVWEDGRYTLLRLAEPAENTAGVSGTGIASDQEHLARH